MRMIAILLLPGFAAMAEPTPVRDVSAFAGTTCAVAADGDVYCWGEGSAGQIGDGRRLARDRPTSVSTLPRRAIRVAAGAEHACALLDQGEVWCWGSNRFGQLGRGESIVDSVTPLQVPSLPGASKIAVGLYHTCVVSPVGAVKCWGVIDTRSPDGWTPPPGTIVDVAVPGSPVSEISVGHEHACALGALGEVHCWGRILIGASSENPTPVSVPGLGPGSGASMISSGAGAACAVVQGAAQCWGWNSTGQLGTGDLLDRPVPATLPGLESGVESIALSSGFGCAGRSGGAVKCWGYTSGGQAGRVSGEQLLVPTEFAALQSSVERFALGNAHGCAIDHAGTLRCWGSNARFALGLPHLQPFRRRPSAALLLRSDNATLSVGLTTCGRGVAGDWRCVGSNETAAYADGSQTTLPGTFSPSLPGAVLETLFPQRSASCALDVGARLWCWGVNWAGNVGDGTALPRLTPVQVSALGTAPRDYSASDIHSCAVDHRGGTWCWGNNSEGVLGDGGTVDRYVPMPVGGSKVDAAQIAAGRVHTCRLSTAGAVSCWGAGFFGQLGNGSSNGSLLPIDVAGLEEVAVQLDAGDFHSCAVTAQGNLYCWGLNAFSQLGVAVGDATSMPTLVPRLAGAWRRVTAGRQHTCAEIADGRVACWGWNSIGQAGAATGDIVATPTLVDLPAPATLVAAGPMHTCALLSGGDTWCWGTNVFGELGSGVVGHTAIPQEVRLALFADQFEG